MHCPVREFPILRPGRSSWPNLLLALCTCFLCRCLPARADLRVSQSGELVNPPGLYLTALAGGSGLSGQVCVLLHNTTNSLLYKLVSYPRLGDAPCTEWPTEGHLWGASDTNVTATNIVRGQRTNLFFWAQAWGPTNGQVVVTLASNHTSLRAVVNGVTTLYNAFACTMVLLPAPVQTLNVGYDHGDGGSTQIPDFTPQNVVAIHGLSDSLTTLCASHTPLASLDVHGLAGVQDIECYQCTNLTQVNVAHCPSLTRACFEECQVQGVLDFSGDVNLQDIRGALNRYTNILFAGAGPKVWHLCVRDNPQLSQNLVLTNFHSLQEWLVWNCNQTGAVTAATMPSTNLSHVLLYSNRLESADFSGQSALGTLSVANNRLTNLSVYGCERLTVLDAHANQLTTVVLDAILIELERLGNRSGQLDLSNNPQRPSATGYAAADHLSKRLHWSVLVDP